MAIMQQESQTQQFKSLREKAMALVEQTESEELLAEVIAIFNGISLPCAYSYQQMEASLHEAEMDYEKGNHVSHSSLKERYGV